MKKVISLTLCLSLLWTEASQAALNAVPTTPNPIGYAEEIFQTQTLELRATCANHDETGFRINVGARARRWTSRLMPSRRLNFEDQELSHYVSPLPGPIRRHSKLLNWAPRFKRLFFYFSILVLVVLASHTSDSSPVVQSVIDRLLPSGLGLAFMFTQRFLPKIARLDVAAPSFDWLDQSIQASLKEYERIHSLRRSELNAERINALRAELDANEAALLDGIKIRLSDEATSFPIFMELAENELIVNKAIDLIMISVPLVDTTKLSAKYQIDGLTDEFKSRLHTRLRANGVKAALLSGRVVVQGLPAEWTANQLPDFIRQAQDDVIRQYTTHDMDLEESESFKDAIHALQFYSSHARVYLDPEPSALILPNPRDYPAFEKALDKDKPNSDDYSDKTKEQYLDDYDRYLSLRRKALSQSARFWQDHGDRGTASLIFERLLEDAIQRLNERIELVEKASGTRLRGTVDRILRERARQTNRRADAIPNLDDSAIRLLSERLLNQEARAAKRLKNPDQTPPHFVAEMYQMLQTGRAKTLPMARYTADKTPPRFPRLAHLVSQLEDDLSLRNAFYRLNSDPTETNLQLFKSAYDQHHLQLLRLLLLAYRDPRLDTVYKLDWMDEVLQADQKGSLAELRRHIFRLLGPGIDPALLAHLYSLAWDMGAGHFVFKRPYGDETGFIVRDRNNKYWMAFSEMNGGNAYFAQHPPDAKDSVYHEVVLGFHNAAGDYARGQTDKPLSFLNTLDDIAQEVAPEEFESTAKVPPMKNEKTQKTGLERMAAYIPQGSGLKNPTNAVSKEFHHYEYGAQGWEFRGVITQFLKGKIDHNAMGWEPLMRKLTTARVYTTREAQPGIVLSLFNWFDKNIDKQKADENLLHRVIDIEQLTNPAWTAPTIALLGIAFLITLLLPAPVAKEANGWVKLGALLAVHINQRIQNARKLNFLSFMLEAQAA